MNKKSLIWESIIAVMILVLASFTPVIGFHNVKSSVRDSPLFHMRTSRAVNEESKKVLLTNYVGRGQENSFLLPPRAENRLLLHRFINWVSRIDESLFNRFLGLITANSEKDPKLKEYSPVEISDALQYARTNPDAMLNYVIEDEPTAQVLGCIYLFIFAIILAVYLVIGIFCTIIISFVFGECLP